MSQLESVPEEKMFNFQDPMALDYDLSFTSELADPPLVGFAEISRMECYLRSARMNKGRLLLISKYIIINLTSKTIGCQSVYLSLCLFVP